MKLGADGIYVELAGEAFELRPSLRAGMRLVRRHGFPRLFAAVQDFHLTVIMDVLKEMGHKSSLILDDIAAFGLGRVCHRLTGPLTLFVLALAGHDPDDTTPPEPITGKPVEPEQLFAQLFRVATGWLGWTPEDAWNATPAEIIAARDGRTDLIMDVLKAVFGSTDEKPSAAPYTPDQLKKIEEEGRDPAFNRSKLHSLKNKGRAR